MGYVGGLVLADELFAEIRCRLPVKLEHDDS